LCDASTKLPLRGAITASRLSVRRLNGGYAKDGGGDADESGILGVLLNVVLYDIEGHVVRPGLTHGLPIVSAMLVRAREEPLVILRRGPNQGGWSAEAFFGVCQPTIPDGDQVDVGGDTPCHNASPPGVLALLCVWQ